MFVFVRLYSLLVHLVVGVQEAFHMANSYHFIEFILFLNYHSLITFYPIQVV